jgi:hypothetical protein
MPREEPPSPSPAPAPPAGFAHDAVRVKHAALATLRLRCVLCGDSAVGKTDNSHRMSQVPRNLCYD